MINCASCGDAIAFLRLTIKIAVLFLEIERGLLLSYNPGANDFIDQIVNTALDNSDNLNTGIYCKLNL
ncbi:hypothetical protein [Anabaena cylindrica]|uniref:hypothetical protein n=1 Tax=Anabaena cylindrica TaxID=1165 RepID=UPI002B1EA726|nr:hypothetical protein [Anabaena cylindrica]